MKIKKILISWLRKYINNHAPNKMSFVYADRKGNTYYKYDDDFDIPIKRIREIELRLKRVRAGMSTEEQIMLLTECKKALNNGNKPDLARVGFIIEEMLTRDSILIHEELWLDIIALIFIRQDEKAHEMNWTIHKQKVEQFKEDSAEDKYNFFLQSGLGTYIPYLTKLENDWSEHYQESQIKIRAMAEMVKRFS